MVILVNDDWIHDLSMRFRLAIVLVWVAAMAPFSAIAQYNNTEGYTCNGLESMRSTYAFYRTFKDQESLAKVAGYFRLTAASVADASGLTNLAPNAALPIGQPLYIPLDCRCDQNYVTSQMPVPYIIQAGDTFALVAMTIFGGLTTYQAMLRWNPRIDVRNLLVGDTTQVPIFCACPTLPNPTKLLVTYSRYAGETLDFISSNFGITTAQLSAANWWVETSNLENFTTLLVPVESLPPIANMKFPNVIMSPTNISPTATSSQRKKLGVIAVLSAGAVAVLLVLGLYIARHRRRASSKKQDKSSDFSLVDPNLALRMFTYKELTKATKNFRRSEFLGSGGFGAVYKGTLPSGALVAVKRMRMESKHGKESFRAEVTSLSHLRHRNLVQLRGWCHEDEQLFLVYDYMCNGNLHEWIFRFSDRIDREAKFPLTLRHSVLCGVAASLFYLHDGCAQCVLHRDIKSSNVLLDGDLNAYLSDFGLARLIDHQKIGKTTMMAGTFGYMAPEMLHTGKSTKESDVYSFGVLTLEVICGARPLDMAAMELGDVGILVDKVWQAHEAGNILQVADSRLGTFPLSDASLGSRDELESEEESRIVMHGPGTGMEDKELIMNLLHLGLMCCNPNPEDRPSTRLVSQVLMLQSSESMEMCMPPLPSRKPQARYNMPGFSEVLDLVPLSECNSLGLGNMEEAGHEAGQATVPLSDVPNGEAAAKIETSFVASSAIYSGR